MDTNLLRSAEILKQSKFFVRDIAADGFENAIQIRYDADRDQRATAATAVAAQISYVNAAGAKNIIALRNVGAGLVADTMFSSSATGTLATLGMTLKSVVDEINEWGGPNGWTARLVDLHGGHSPLLLGCRATANCFGVWFGTSLQLLVGDLHNAAVIHLGVRLPGNPPGIELDSPPYKDGIRSKILQFVQFSLDNVGGGVGNTIVREGDTAAELLAPIMTTPLAAAAGAAVITTYNHDVVGKDLCIECEEAIAFTVGQFHLTAEIQRVGLVTSEAFMSGQNPESIGF